ncbi:MAG: NmrA family NAD(P)-binding protein, partial [bacterium]|nr:NmrA family NAD(P)-binding protein [bacterium]
MLDEKKKRVLVAGATGYLGKFAVKAFKERGYSVRALTRSEERLAKPGPFTAPAISKDDVDEIFVGELTRPETLSGLM